MWPAAANAASVSPATPASSAENRTLGALPGLSEFTTKRSASSGKGRVILHGNSRYRFPAERSLAEIQAKRNHGCASSMATRCCPTRPVAPKTPTSILFVTLTQSSRRCDGVFLVGLFLKVIEAFEQVFNEISSVLASWREANEVVRKSEARAFFFGNGGVGHARGVAD